MGAIGLRGAGKRAPRGFSTPCVSIERTYNGHAANARPAAPHSGGPQTQTRMQSFQEDTCVEFPAETSRKDLLLRSARPASCMPLARNIPSSLSQMDSPSQSAAAVAVVGAVAVQAFMPSAGFSTTTPSLRQVRSCRTSTKSPALLFFALGSAHARTRRKVPASPVSSPCQSLARRRPGLTCR